MKTRTISDGWWLLIPNKKECLFRIITCTFRSLFTQDLSQEHWHVLLFKIWGIFHVLSKFFPNFDHKEMFQESIRSINLNKNQEQIFWFDRLFSLFFHCCTQTVDKNTFLERFLVLAYKKMPFGHSIPFCSFAFASTNLGYKKRPLKAGG